jgi:hypothetical protein
MQPQSTCALHDKIFIVAQIATIKTEEDLRQSTVR